MERISLIGFEDAHALHRTTIVIVMEINVIQVVYLVNCMFVPLSFSVDPRNMCLEDQLTRKQN